MEIGSVSLERARSFAVGADLEGFGAEDEDAVVDADGSGVAWVARGSEAFGIGVPFPFEPGAKESFLRTAGLLDLSDFIYPGREWLRFQWPNGPNLI